MKRKIVNYLFLIIGFMTILYSCRKEEETITPREFPTVNIEGFKFPEDSGKIYTWLENQDTTSIVKHAWGIWAGLTEPTKEKYNGQDLLTFETWNGVQELMILTAQGKTTKDDLVKISRTNLNVPKQFIHGQIFGGQRIDSNFVVLETVSYDPSASYFATSNKLFKQSELKKFLVKDGVGSIPEFPNTSITSKPTYYVGVPDKNGLIRVPVWVKPNPDTAFRYDKWTTFVYVDINNKQEPNKKLTPVTKSNPTDEEINAATCNVNDFINYKIDRVGADYLNMHQDAGTPATRQFIEGDYILLVAMHVTTKEIKNWTWQTYFWCPDPSNPPSPSSKFEAGLRPKELKGAASHYAVSVAWTFVWPNQPITGGTDKGGRPVIAFNPYLEGGFGPGVFSLPNKFNPNFVYGMQTNCMSCHALSTMTGKNGYTTDQYIDMEDTSLFKNDVKLDFTWSIQGNLITTDK